MWTTESTAVSSARPETIWALWSNVAKWQTWDDALTDSSLETDFAVGSQGTLTPKGAPQSFGFRLTEVTPLRSFSDITELPGATLTFDHLLEVTADGTRITHRIQISGDAWEGYAARMSEDFERELPHAVTKLARLAETLEGVATLETA
jgi:Polyketide cyclase / dehydrase and lipid transport